jgi:hypothetical protein
MTNPRNVAECLRPCPGDRVEVAPGHCCWPGQAWNIDTEECEGRAVACTAHMRLATGECVPIAGPCQTSADCNDDSLCLAGRCEPGHRFRRLEVFADGAPVVLGYWRFSHSGGYPSSPLARGDFSLRGAAGLAVRVSRSVHPRWSFGGYLGYLRAADGQVDDVRTSYPETVPAVVELSTVRIGGLGNCRWGRRRGLVYGLGLEAGFVFGTARAGDWDWGGEIAPDFFLDVPLGSGRSRSFLTFSLGFRAGLIEYSRVPGYGTATEDWYYFMPVLRLGFGTGH